MAEQIVVENLVKQFGAQAALGGVSFDVAPGTFLVLLGPSGSGKTTLVRCLAGIERITSGTIVLGARTVANAASHVPPERRGLSMVFQDYALWPHLNAVNNVAFALRRSRVPKSAAVARASDMLDRVGLTAQGTKYPSQLSGGEQQRVALARALIGGTGLILFDEPLSNLDADLRERMRIEIASLVRTSEVTAVYITHDQAEAFALADQVGVLQGGQLVQFDTPEALYSSPASAFVARFTGLSAELPGRIVGPARGSLDRIEVEVSSRSSVRPIEATRGTTNGHDRDVHVMIRPSAVRLCPATSPDCQMIGSVTDVAFRGRGYEHAVELAEGAKVTGVFHSARFARGDTVGLTIEFAGCMAFTVPDPPESPGSDEPSKLRADRDLGVGALGALAMAK
ncbi:MAG TPA: ABC transporter ATP-binding protein [Acidimicrobiales bacterium]|nr:ABC transporter ATP-binding protein [Acidimicrobiales bacterium]